MVGRKMLAVLAANGAQGARHRPPSRCQYSSDQQLTSVRKCGGGEGWSKHIQDGEQLGRDHLHDFTSRCTDSFRSAYHIRGKCQSRVNMESIRRTTVLDGMAEKSVRETFQSSPERGIQMHTIPTLWQRIDAW